jgi:hypothetical protein
LSVHLHPLADVLHTAMNPGTEYDFQYSAMHLLPNYSRCLGVNK